MTRLELATALRLVVITDAHQAAPRSVSQVVQIALAAGCRAIQLRDKEAPARELVEQARGLLRLTRAVGGYLFINDRMDVAVAADADGVHLGPLDLPVSAARRMAPDGFVIGASTDDPVRARDLVAAGADYIGCGAVFGTTSKEVGDEAIGLARLDDVTRAVPVPVVGIGGITAEGAARIAHTTDAAGVAVIGAVMKAGDPGAAVRDLLAPFTHGQD